VSREHVVIDAFFHQVGIGRGIGDGIAQEMISRIADQSIPGHTADDDHEQSDCQNKLRRKRFSDVVKNHNTLFFILMFQMAKKQCKRNKYIGATENGRLERTDKN
jgi:hypothetical protein